MSKHYHYLVAGLPDLLFDDSKLQINLRDFREIMEENLTEEDQALLRLFFYRYDNQNILDRLRDPECEIDPKGNLDTERLDQLFAAAREGAMATDLPELPAYLLEFVTAYQSDTPIREGKSWDLQLSDLYYARLEKTANDFIRDYFRFERDVANLVTAAQARKYEFDVEKQLTGSGEIVEKLARSNAHDFGLDNEFPYLEDILKAIDEQDIKEFELRLDRIHWDYLDEKVFFYYFTIERVFSFLIKVAIIERWLTLDKETGQKLFKELLSNMEASHEFPEEFKLKK